MVKSDLTVIYLTLNLHPKGWTEYHKKILLEAVGDNELITISRKPLDFGKNILQTHPREMVNVWRQMLIGARLAKTKYIAIAEDDTLYHKSHFNYRPVRNAFAYERTYWKLFNWGTPTYHCSHRMMNFALVCPRKLTIEALEERFDKNLVAKPSWKKRPGELGRGKLEKYLGFTPRPSYFFDRAFPVLNILHDQSLDTVARKQRSKAAYFRAFDIPYWGRADEIIKKFS